MVSREHVNAQKRSYMIINKQASGFTPITVTFDNEAEFHDVVAALAAYAQKRTGVSGTEIPEEYNLTAYTGYARKTVERVLSQLAQAL